METCIRRHTKGKKISRQLQVDKVLGVAPIAAPEAVTGVAVIPPFALIVDLKTAKT